jgi:hypothetical protein
MPDCGIVSLTKKTEDAQHDYPNQRPVGACWRRSAAGFQEARSALRINGDHRRAFDLGTALAGPCRRSPLTRDALARQVKAASMLARAASEGRTVASTLRECPVPAIASRGPSQHLPPLTALSIAEHVETMIADHARSNGRMTNQT